ncbi:MAG: hypothetical protein K1X51_09475 [Rhodospirillaceae bacterium]|nr:hypothetical protein [Rhodospirillaceae bacterium]
MTDVLMFIEDPGAVNFMAPVIPALKARGLSVATRVTGAATAFIHVGGAHGAVPPEGDADAMLAAVKPRLVLTGTSENLHSLGFGLIQGARAQGLVTAAMVDGPSNAALRFRGTTNDALAFAPDHVMVPDAVTAAAFVALGYPKSRVFVCGHPHYDWVSARGEELKRAGKSAVRRRVLGDVPAEVPVIVFAAEVSTGLVPALYRASDRYTIHGSGKSVYRSDIVIEELLGALALVTPKPYTVLRLHPKNTEAELAPFFAGFDTVSMGGSALELVFASDAVVGMTSILLAEAAILGRPVLAILPRLEEYEWLPSILRGQIPLASTRAQIQEGVAALLSHHGDSGVPTIAFEPDAAAHAAGVIASLIRP